MIVQAYWRIGRIIVEHEQNGSLRAEYGKAVLQEIEAFHLSTLKLAYEEAVSEYEKRKETRLERLIANRELPILRRVKEMIG